MPEFLIDYINELNKKLDRIKNDFGNKGIEEFKDVFEKYWVKFDLVGYKPDFNVLAIDSSSSKFVTSNGGIFYIIRALGLSKTTKYRKLIADFDYSPDSTHIISHVLGRMMEYAEHLVAIDAIKTGFDGYILIDGSIYGRLAHIPMEVNFANANNFMLSYFEGLIELLNLCKKNRILLIGISKESRTSFFREFLIKEIFNELEIDETTKNSLLSLALDNKRKAIEEAEKTENEKVIKLIKELVNRKPDFQLIATYAESSGYTFPLLLGASQRWRREYDRIARNPREFVISHFPLSSRDDEFLKKAVKVAREILELPAIVSFHLLPSINDTPMRVDIPAWHFGIDEKITEVGWPEAIEVDIDEILKVILAGYCGLNNYNLWLTAVDSKVKFTRDVFENLYLPKFEEIVGRFATPRGYRRVRYP